MKPLVVHPEVKPEIVHERSYYEKKDKGLGRRFQAVLKAAFQRIQRYPNRVPRRQDPYRKLPITPFPFEIIFREYDDYIEIVAVKHNSRHPDYWKHRISTES
jgi:plasmid stabilization system protein ParE